MTYRQTTAANIQPPVTNMGSHNINVGKDTAATILTCMLHAHLINIAEPGSYNNEINKLLKLNNLPTRKSTFPQNIKYNQNIK